MEANKATAPNILKKSTASAYSTEEKIRNLEKRVEEYITRVNQVEDLLSQLEETTDEYPPVPPSRFTISWVANEQPRVTQRDREIAIWRTWTKDDVDLYCNERINDL